MTSSFSEPKSHLYISIAGVMGSGKTTVSNLLSKEFGFRLFEENVDENTFLPLFYKDPKRWAFHAQLFYLREKAGQLAKIRHLLQDRSVVQDSPLHQDYLTYAKAQQILGNMNAEEFALYEKYFHTVNEHLPVPDLIIQLEASPEALAKRIKQRARDYEKRIDISYLQLLTRLQNEWISASPHLNIVKINTETLNLATNDSHQVTFAETVKNKLQVLASPLQPMPAFR